MHGPGISRVVSPVGEAIYWRDSNGVARGRATLINGALSIQVCPDWRRRGIATEIMQLAVAVWEIDFEKQCYSDLGRKFFKTFLAGRTAAVD
jgi:GNAT superfamily N-acetyltransferase